MSLTRVTNRVLANDSVGVAQLSAGAVPNKLGSEIGPFAFRNKIINGAMEIDQRNAGASKIITTNTQVYSLDRWYGAALGAAVTHQRVAVTAPRVSYALRVTGAASNTTTWVAQRIESNLAAQVANLPVTLSFYAASNTLTQLRIGYGAASVVDTHGSTVNDTNIDIPITSTLTHYSISFTAPSTFSNGAYVSFFSNGPLLAGQTITITGVQLEEGSYATPFEQRPIGTELALCQRYYEFNSSTFSNPMFSGNVTTGANYYSNGVFKVTKRATPTVTLTNTFGSRFPSSAGAAAAISLDSFYEFRVANSTGDGYFSSTFTASAEL